MIRYVEPLSAARTTLAGFFSILLGVRRSWNSSQLTDLVPDVIGTNE
jgi:hypothetical protein